MKRRVVFETSLAVVATLVLCAGAASANVLAEKSVPQKHRRDIGKQLGKYTLCLVKAAQTCEKKGLNSGVECHLDTGVVDNAGTVDPKGKFLPAIQKCKAKVLLAKKGTGNALDDYEAIGCPGDSNTSTSGDQPYADLTAYQAGSLASTPTQIAPLAAAIDGFGCQPHAAGSTDPADIACVAADAAALGKYTQGVLKCEDKCENDYKPAPSKGSGGGTDGANCNDGDVGADATFQTCASAALSAAGPMSPGTVAIVLPAVRAALNKAENDLYNQNDCP